MADEFESGTPSDPLTRSAEVVGNILGTATRAVTDAAQTVASAASRTTQSATGVVANVAETASGAAQSVSESASAAAAGAIEATAVQRRAVRRTVRRTVKKAQRTVKVTTRRVTKAVAAVRKGAGARKAAAQTKSSGGRSDKPSVSARTGKGNAAPNRSIKRTSGAKRLAAPSLGKPSTRTAGKLAPRGRAAGRRG